MPVAMAPATSPSVISRMRAPVARTSAMRSLVARSVEDDHGQVAHRLVPLALATASRLSSMGMGDVDGTPAARGPTASFSM